MEIITDIRNYKCSNSIVILGKFDGFHIGHQQLFQTAVQLKKGDMKTVVFTFDINPNLFLEKSMQQTILTREERYLSGYPREADYVIEFPFNRETMVMEPEFFVKHILVELLDVKYIVAGYDFRFGKDRKGDVHTLEKLGSRYGFQVKVLDKVMLTLDGYEEPAEVSSTLIKEEIRLGHMENVTRMLGRPFGMTGIVQHGKHLGETIGFPTANLRVPSDKILPPDGVYAVQMHLQEEQADTAYFPGMTNVGQRPTFADGTERNVETNVFGFHENIYGKCITVEFYHYIRPERKFAGVRDLTEQLEQDRNAVLQYFRFIKTDHENTK